MARTQSPPQSPWVLPCSNALLGEENKEVSLTWLSWDPPPPMSSTVGSRPNSRQGPVSSRGLISSSVMSTSSRRGQMHSTSINGERRKPVEMGGLTNTTVLTFNQVTWLPSIQWARQREMEKRRLEVAARERIESAQAMQRCQSEPRIQSATTRKLGRRGKRPDSGVSQSALSQTPSTSSVASPGKSLKSKSSAQRRSPSSSGPQPPSASESHPEEIHEDQSTVQARVFAGSRRSVRQSRTTEASPKPKDEPVSDDASQSGSRAGTKRMSTAEAEAPIQRRTAVKKADKGSDSLALYKRHSSFKKTTSIYEAVDKRTLRLVFWKFADQSSRIPHVSLKPALELLGYKDVAEASVTRVATDTVGRGDQGMTFQQYEQFCEAFDQVYMLGVKKGFREADLDNSGKISAAEVAILLQRLGITVMPGMVHTLLQEVGCGPENLADLDQYLHLVEIVRLRGGFTQQETEEFSRLFRQFDYNDNGTIDQQEFSAALKWLGFVQEKHGRSTLQYLLEGIEREGGEVLEPEFLQAMRRYCEFEISWISDLFKEQDVDSVAVIDQEGAVKIFKALGFRLANTEHVQEASQNIKTPSRTEFFFEDVVMMVRDLRTREGFLKRNVVGYQEVFDSHDVDGGGQLDVVELGGVLRWLGNPACLEIQLNLMEEVDVDKSGYLDFNEFLKAMRRFQEQELDTLETLFRKADVDSSGHLSFKEMKNLYRILGFNLTPSELKLLKAEFANREASFEECYAEVSVLREQQRQRFRESAGFNNKELRDLEYFFKANEQNGSLSKSSLLKKVSLILPETPNDEFVDNLMSKYGDTGGRLAWSPYLRCIRLVQDRHDFQQLEREEASAKQCGFSREQVIELRRLFKMCDRDGSQQIDFDEMSELFSHIMTMNSEAVRNLHKALEANKVDMRKGLDFEQFLHLVSDIAKKDFQSKDDDAGAGKRKSARNSMRMSMRAPPSRYSVVSASS